MATEQVKAEEQPGVQPGEEEGTPEEGIEGGEESLDALRAELALAQAALREQEALAEALQAEVAAALERYRAVLIAGHPDIPEEMVQGETVADLEASFEQARSLVDRLRRQVEERVARERVPTGAPARRSPDASALSPQGKIILGLQRLSQG